MIRTQLYIHKQERKNLISLAKQKNSSMGEIIRGFIKEGLKKEECSGESGKKIMLEISRLDLKGGPVDLSSNLDKYLY